VWRGAVNAPSGERGCAGVRCDLGTAKAESSHQVRPCRCPPPSDLRASLTNERLQGGLGLSVPHADLNWHGRCVGTPGINHHMRWARLSCGYMTDWANKNFPNHANRNDCEHELRGVSNFPLPGQSAVNRSVARSNRAPGANIFKALESKVSTPFYLKPVQAASQAAIIGFQHRRVYCEVRRADRWWESGIGRRDTSATALSAGSPRRGRMRPRGSVCAASRSTLCATPTPRN
jgi:hypothetical protein